MTDQTSIDEDQQDLNLDDQIKDALEANEAVEEVAEETPEVEEPEPIEPLEAWSEDWKNTFKSRSREAQEFIMELNKSMQGDYTRKTQALAEERKSTEQQLNDFNAYQQAIQPMIKNWQMQGLHPARGVAQLVAYGQQLQADPTGTLMQLAKDYGVNLNEALEEQPYIDPQVRTLQEKNKKLEQQFNSYTQQQNQAQQLQQQEASAKQALEFYNLKDDSGKSVCPHIQEGSPHREKLVQFIDQYMYMDNSQDYQQAYEMAVWTIPEVRKSILDEQKKSELAQQQAEVKKAQNAKPRIVSKSKDAPEEDFTLDDIISSNLKTG
jgi:hypothetical protein